MSYSILQKTNNICKPITHNEIETFENLYISNEQAVKILKTIAHPIRLKILKILTFRDNVCNCDFISFFDEKQAIISKQISILIENGLVESNVVTKEGTPGRWHAYSIVNENKVFISSIISIFSRKTNPEVIELDNSLKEFNSMKKTRVIFICTGNSIRSQIAEAFLRRKAGEHFEVHSAGSIPKGIHPLTIKVMEEKRYDLTDHTSKNLKEYLGKIHFGIRITVCDKAEQNCPVFPGVGTKLYWPFEDPGEFQGTDEEVLNKFREIRDQIEKKIDEFLESRQIIPQ